MFIEIIQTPENGTIYKRHDGLQISVSNCITIFFEDNVKLLLNIKTSNGNLAFPLPCDEDLQWMLNAIEQGKFNNRPVTYDYVEAKLFKNEKEYEAFLPWTNED